MTNVPPGFEPLPLGGRFSDTLGAIYLDRARGRLRWRVEPAHANPFGVCHGGALATFADWQVAALREGSNDAVAHTPTISLAVDYLAPIPVGSWVEAAVAVDRTTRTMIFSRAVFTVEGEVVGRSHAIYRNSSSGDPR